MKYPFSELFFDNVVKVTKKDVLLIIAGFDLVSVLIMLRFACKIYSMNKERYEQIQDGSIQARDFTIQLKDVQLNKYTQDTRFLKMKIWLRFSQVFQGLAVSGKAENSEDAQVIDINFTSHRFGKLDKISELADICEKINQLEELIDRKTTTIAQVDEARVEIEALQQLYQE